MKCLFAPSAGELRHELPHAGSEVMELLQLILGKTKRDGHDPLFGMKACPFWGSPPSEGPLEYPYWGWHALFEAAFLGFGLFGAIWRGGGGGFKEKPVWDKQEDLLSADSGHHCTVDPHGLHLHRCKQQPAAVWQAFFYSPAPPPPPRPRPIPIVSLACFCVRPDV